jgi:hypothetical protein
VARGNARTLAWSQHIDRAWDGAVARSPAASQQQGVARDLEGATGEVLSKEVGAGAHRSSGPTARRRKRHQAAVFNDGRVAPVVVDECGGVL